MGKPFEPVERLPVPPEVDAAFRKLAAKQQGSGRAWSHAGGAGYGVDPARAAAKARADVKLAEAEAEAASHFGGDVGKMTTHYKRWTRWGKRFMSAPAASEAFAMDAAESILDSYGDYPGATLRGKKPVRRQRT